MELYKLTETDAGFLTGKTYAKDMIFNPVQDINGDWFISEEEVKGNTNRRYKDILSKLELAEFLPPKFDFEF
jgi:hypothetical protein